MDNDVLLVEKKGNVATLSFNRPEKKNALSIDLLIKLYQTLEEYSKSDEVKAVIIRGEGDVSFSSGFDISSIPTKASQEVMEVMKTKNPLGLALDMVKNFQYPTIAMLNGYVYGAGFNLAVCCDIRIAADDIRMNMPPAKLGAVYHAGGIQQFIEAIGLGKTKEVFLTARTYKGADLISSGLVDYLLPREELEAFTHEYADKITRNAPLALKGMKKIINMFGSNLALNEMQETEAAELVRASFQSDDLKEGQTAFLEKRKPNFTGK
ncbi:MAG: enoyl-CoA hydratase [Proteobacteria bacterium]|nr:enoyl-CoA hydratase [Pseudomonadota bacterium]